MQMSLQAYIPALITFGPFLLVWFGSYDHWFAKTATCLGAVMLMAALRILQKAILEQRLQIEELQKRIGGPVASAGSSG